MRLSAAAAVLLILSTQTFLHAATIKSLPVGITSCKANDPNLNECFVRSANLAIPTLYKGDADLKLIRFDPLHVKELHIDDSGSPRQVALDLLLTDIDYLGLSKVKLTNASVDLDKNTITFNGFAPRLEIVGQYKVSGRILILPIAGEGPINITLSDISFRMTLTTNRETRKSNVEMFKLQHSSLKFEPGHCIVKLDNLFNGDKRLGDNMNVFLNENWRELVEDIGGPLGEVFNQATSQVVSRFFTLFPAEQIFPKN